MANNENLKKGKATQFKAGEEQVKIARKGGIASGKAKRRKKLLKEYLEEALEKNYKTGKGDMSGAEAITVKLMEQAVKGNIKAYQTIRDTIGQAPVQKLQVNEVDPEVAKKVDELVDECLCEDADKPSE